MLADDVVEVELVEVGKGKVISYLYDKGYAPLLSPHSFS